MREYSQLKRQQFLVLAATTVGGTLAARAGETSDPRIVSLKDAHKGTLEIDLRIMNQYNVQPREMQDFYTAGRVALTGSNPEAALAGCCRLFNRAILGGPMLGDLTSSGVSVWQHLPEPVSVEVKMAPKTGGVFTTFTSEAARFQVVRCEGLLPDTEYCYTVTDSKGRELGGGDVMTAPEALSEKPLKIAFGTCFHKVGLYRPELLKLVRERDNRSMLVLGDSAVDGRGNNYGLVNADYLLRNLSRPWQQLAANVPVFAIWDDHDYWGDDSGGTTTRGRSIDPVGLRKSWKTQWNNPERDMERKGIYFQTQIGPIHYIALDTRSCRIQEARGELNSFLGKEQMDWVKHQLRESTAPYILLSGGTMWSDYISNGKDSWGTWDKEGREEIFQLIDAKKDSQVILLCGDRHGARGFAIPRPGNKKIYEFEVATLGGVPGPGAFGKDKSAQLFGLPSRSWAFGEFSFCEVDGVPKATFRLVNERGEEVETVVLEA
ncbi:alkaline phosphatase D family protein [Pontiellaceae bacterium B12227]|nr:alkaline phosphatase D family protein [Pontiellaceae bacterium B12227]